MKLRATCSWLKLVKTTISLRFKKDRRSMAVSVFKIRPYPHIKWLNNLISGPLICKTTPWPSQFHFTWSCVTGTIWRKSKIFLLNSGMLPLSSSSLLHHHSKTPWTWFQMPTLNTNSSRLLFLIQSWASAPRVTRTTCNDCKKWEMPFWTHQFICSISPSLRFRRSLKKLKMAMHPGIWTKMEPIILNCHHCLMRIAVTSPTLSSNDIW